MKGEWLLLMLFKWFKTSNYTETDVLSWLFEFKMEVRFFVAGMLCSLCKKALPMVDTAPFRQPRQHCILQVLTRYRHQFKI